MLLKITFAGIIAFGLIGLPQIAEDGQMRQCMAIEQETSPPKTQQATEYVKGKLHVVVKKVEASEDSKEMWLQKLIMCESGGDPNALNPMDLDGTPSHGLLQFKVTTFEFFSKAYEIEGELYDPEAQKEIVRRMMDDPSVIWENQFPACVEKLGRPPGT